MYAHANCSHENTTAARAACRRRRIVKANTTAREVNKELNRDLKARNKWNHDLKVWVEITDRDVLAKIKVAGDALRACGQYSSDNPTVSLKDNPFVKPADKAHREATGSMKNMWACAQGLVMMPLNDNLRCSCCDGAIYEI